MNNFNKYTKILKPKENVNSEKNQQSSNEQMNERRKKNQIEGKNQLKIMNIKNETNSIVYTYLTD